jgi:hypothetical protein
MEIKRTISKIVYRIEPRPEGGFIARASDPGTPPLEAATREELQEKIQAAISATLAAEFPGLKPLLESKELKYSFHIEPKPGGGFIAHSTDPNHPPIEGATHEEVQHGLAEKLAGALGSYLLPELNQVPGKQIDSGNVKIVVNRKVSVTAKAVSPNLGLRDVQELPQEGSIQGQEGEKDSLLNLTNNSPIVPDEGGNWPLFRFLLVLVILGALMYFFLHRG